MKKVISTEKIPIKLWLDDCESGVIDQASNLANLPFAFKHIAIMPDAHQGYGMPIGGVMATKNVIVPNAVGCFTGDTKIPLLDGLQRTLKELHRMGGSYYVYSLDKNLKLVAGKARAKLTKRNTNLVEIVISGGEIIRCTPDHKFMLLNGVYKEAKDLQKFDSLMPLYRSYQSRDGYERIKTKSGNGIETHRMVAEQFLGKRKKSDITHHKDENWFNNNPKNIEYKDVSLHSKEHRKSNPIFGTEEFKKKRLKKLKEKGFYDKKFTEKKKKIAIKNISEYNKSDKKKEQDKLAGKRGRKYLIRYNKQKRENNHKVLHVGNLFYKEDVYCLTVEKYHNFALSAGVFVHNCDIGCGMCAVKTSLTEISIDNLKKIMGEIRNAIPLGPDHHKEMQDSSVMPDDDFREYKVISKEYFSALKQLGTLGGGNHFIEIQKGNDNHIWIMVHSGSRNIGYKVAEYYNKLAIFMNGKWSSEVPKSFDLAFLPTDSEEGQAYIREMNYCVDFALVNRKLMMDRIKKIFVELTSENLGTEFGKITTFDEMINIAHNYARMENHFKENVMVHRKGATLATKDTIGIIPGSCGTKSYIVKGLGNPESFNSCSHGAGRTMSRSQAKEDLDLEEQKKIMTDQGIIHGIRNVGDLDEAPGSYKNIDIVMENQKDLVEILVELTPLAVIKG